MAAHRVLSQTLGEIILRCTETLGTSGAVATTPTRMDGFTSMSSAGSGVYTLLLQRGAPELVEFYGTVKQASYSKTGACKVELTTDNVAGATPSITFTCVDGDGDAVQPATGDIIRIKAVVKR